MSKRPEIQIPVDVQDAWEVSFTLIKGISGILSILADSDEGLSPEGCQALNMSVDHLLEQMKIVDPLFKVV